MTVGLFRTMAQTAAEADQPLTVRYWILDPSLI